LKSQGLGTHGILFDGWTVIIEGCLFLFVAGFVMYMYIMARILYHQQVLCGGYSVILIDEPSTYMWHKLAGALAKELATPPAQCFLFAVASHSAEFFNELGISTVLYLERQPTDPTQSTVNLVSLRAQQKIAENMRIDLGWAVYHELSAAKNCIRVYVEDAVADAGFLRALFAATDQTMWSALEPHVTFVSGYGRWLPSAVVNQEKRFLDLHAYECVSLSLVFFVVFFVVFFFFFSHQHNLKLRLFGLQKDL
jgi:hypothetical protein